MANNNNAKESKNADISPPPSWDMRPYEKLDRTGVLDPSGEKINPINGKPYSAEYRQFYFSDKHWRHFPVNEPGPQKMTFEAIQKNQVILVKSGTGSGKSSQVPKFLAHLLGYRGKIAITIPTRLSAAGSATYMAQALDVNLGEEVGYKFRGTNLTNKNGKKSIIFYTTDGSVLSQMLGDDPDLSNINALLMDEVHKRSANIDMLLLLIKELLPRRPDFKLILVSATINTQLFMDYFPTPEYRFAAVEISSKPLRPITQHWLSKPIGSKPDDYIGAAIERTLKILKETESGDILIFLVSNADLRNACDKLQTENRDNLSFCIMASSATIAANPDQRNIVTKQQKNNTKRKVIMSTNVAEESITIENIDFVIDAGLAMKSSYDPMKMAKTLDRVYITKSSAQQRMGRTGRVREGTVYHLYTEKQYADFPEFDEPQIKTIDLADLILKITNMPLVQTYTKTLLFMNNLIEPPSKEAIAAGIRQLEALGCFTKGTVGGQKFSKNIADLGDLTVIGKAMSKLQFEPAIARSLLFANHYFVRVEAMFLYTLLEVSGSNMSSIFRLPRGNSSAEKKLQPFLSPKGDYFTLLNIYNAYSSYAKEHEPAETRRWARQNSINANTLEKVKETYFRQMRSLQDVIAPENIVDEELAAAIAEQANENFKTRDRKLIQAIMEGEGILRTAKKGKRDDYQTIFPPESSYAQLGRETFLPKGSKPKSKLIYNSMLILEGRAKLGPVLFL